MTQPTLTIGGETISLTADPIGYTGSADVNGERVRIFVTLTVVGRTAPSPSRASGRP